VARIHLETVIAAPVERVFDLARDIDLHQRSMAHTGERAIGGRTTGLIGPSESVTFRARQLGIPWTISSRVTSYEPPHRFVDEQTSGPFASFRHEHRFESTTGGTRMIDDWEHVAPLGVLGRLADRLFLERRMRALLVTRSVAIAREAGEHPGL
jgi:ligand-binding SRPBCC domain-containing protein